MNDIIECDDAISLPVEEIMKTHRIEIHLGVGIMKHRENKLFG